MPLRVLKVCDNVWVMCVGDKCEKKVYEISDKDVCVCNLCVRWEVDNAGSNDVGVVAVRWE
jgi:hypothetical protein